MSVTKAWTTTIIDDDGAMASIEVKSSGIRYEITQSLDVIILSKEQLLDLHRVLSDIISGD